VLIAWGRDDPFFPSEHAVRFKMAFSNARLEYIDDAAAFVPEDQPQQLAELIAAFIAEHKTGEPVMTNHT
jgi:pimeloyl-ACP methyl ester carboxylesterase